MKATMLQEKLTKAVEESDLLRISKLLRQGADVNGLNKNGETPLAVACSRAAAKGVELTEVVRYLLRMGADINKFHAGGYTPLFNAVVTNRLHLVQTLLEEGANPNINHFPKRAPKVVSSALDLVFTRYVMAVVKEKKGYYDDFNILQRELSSHRCMMFLLTEAGARRFAREVVPEYS